MDPVVDRGGPCMASARHPQRRFLPTVYKVPIVRPVSAAGGKVLASLTDNCGPRRSRPSERRKVQTLQYMSNGCHQHSLTSIPRRLTGAIGDL
jgi:hypothetical protein